MYKYIFTIKEFIKFIIFLQVLKSFETQVSYFSTFWARPMGQLPQILVYNKLVLKY